ncbi:cytochrome P450 [Streptomyces brasiliensis]|uniref:Cytochrome P450 n=1 Tax=Streptomyces brasiliensis TaxID=1954 RepID=A0A917PBK8_9ACTN|nr:cytochrome P450 [Streptomyces brasiliensis]GGJ69830.1 cytochrome P450 [Streptomyces brasiliensis]
MVAASGQLGPEGSGFGNRLAFGRDALGFLLRQRECGDLVRFDDGLYMVNSPVLVEHVLKNTNGTYGITKDLLGEETDGSRASEDLARWMQARRLAGRGLNRGGLRAARDGMAAVVARYAEGWRATGRIEAIGALEELSARLIAEFCLGSEPGRVPELVARLQDARLPAAVAWPGRVSVLRRRRMRQAARDLAAEVSRLVAARDTGRDGATSVVADLLIEACADGALTFDGAVSVIVANLFAAHETTAAALAWLFLLLERHPQLRGRAVDEVDRELGGRLPTAADLPRLQVTEAVVKETLRLYPPLWYLERVLEEPDVLDGVALLPGQRVAVSPFALHRDPALYDEPAAFHPDRWIDRAAAPRVPGYTYVPFGGGPRMCLGAHFGTVAMVIATATVLSRYRLSPAPDCTPVFHTRTILQPKGLVLDVADREPAKVAR